MLHDPQIMAAIINAVGTTMAAVIAATCAALIGKRFIDRERLQEKLRHALSDIEFMLVVEQEHCNLHRSNGRDSYKLRIRDLARKRGLVWSGRFTPGRVAWNGEAKRAQIDTGAA